MPSRAVASATPMDLAATGGELLRRTRSPAARVTSYGVARPATTKPCSAPLGLVARAAGAAPGNPQPGRGVTTMFAGAYAVTHEYSSGFANPFAKGGGVAPCAPAPPRP